jgi:hypothetical protein
VKRFSGQRPAQGKIMVAGSSAGGMIAASALEWNNDFRKLVDRTVFVSAPLGANLSVECGIITRSSLKTLIDGFFKMKNNPCQLCNGDNECSIPSSKNAVNVNNKNYRYYLTDKYLHHEMAILVGSNDRVGCEREPVEDCGSWQAEKAVNNYINAITGNEPEIFQDVIANGPQNRFSFSVIDRGTHELWLSPITKQKACQNILAEVDEFLPGLGVSYGICVNHLL